jgi:hypothetical protein
MTTNSHDPALERAYAQRLEQEVARIRAESRKAVKEFKRSFPPPTDEQIERLLYPELSEFTVELGGRRFTLRELPALIERKFIRLVEQKLPAIVGEILSFDERLGDDARAAFAHLLARAMSALDLVSDACALVLDPLGEHGVTREFVQQHASTARQIRIVQAQLLLNGARDFLLQLCPILRTPTADEELVLEKSSAREAAEEPLTTPSSPPPPDGSNFSANPPA